MICAYYYMILLCKWSGTLEKAHYPADDEPDETGR